MKLQCSRVGRGGEEGVEVERENRGNVRGGFSQNKYKKRKRKQEKWKVCVCVSFYINFFVLFYLVRDNYLA